MRTFLTFILTFITLINLFAQNSKNDSIAVTKTTVNFFDWYIDAVKKGHTEEYSPIFIKSKNGMTTLNDSVYITNLKKYSFSDLLIYIERQSYDNCRHNLDKIKFTTFESEIKDLDQFEKLECDFNNYFRWVGGQEIVDGFTITNVNFINNSAEITGQSFLLNNLKEKTNNGIIKITLIRHVKNWKIHRIEK